MHFLRVFCFLSIFLTCAYADTRNFVVIMTDDQRFDSLWAMPYVQDRLVRHGVNFTHAVVSTPLCCPARAGFLGGGYLAQNTGVLGNVLPNGGAVRFKDTSSLPLRLQQAGYATALIGKYLNEYQKLGKYIPPGWSHFAALVAPSLAWNDPELVVGSSGNQSAPGTQIRENGYVTDVMQRYALDFLGNVGKKPFFLYLAPNAPHMPATPALEDASKFSDFLYRGGAYGEVDRSDKPLHIQNAPRYYSRTKDAQNRQQLRSLQAIDRLVEAVVLALEGQGKLQNTMIVFMSDNGFLWGEHGLAGKNHPYQESIRVPLVVRMPDVLPREDTSLIVANLDIPATIQDLAGLPALTDGSSLLSLLGNPREAWRVATFLESFQYKERIYHRWVGILNPPYKYVAYATGETELYDLLNDPYELVNQSSNPAMAAIKAALAEQLITQIGLAIMTHTLPSGQVGMPYAVNLEVWGGTPPYTWSVAGSLPPGLTFDTNAGALTGTPTVAQSFSLTFTVRSHKMATQRGELQKFSQKLSLVIQ